jgi:hypothetical protein
MSEKLLQLNFKFSVSATDYEGAVSPLARDFAAVPGLRWKIWLMNEDRHEAGGLYMFEDAPSLKAFLEGPLAKGVMGHPALSDFSAKTFDIMDSLTAVTRGPVKVPATA